MENLIFEGQANWRTEQGVQSLTIELDDFLGEPAEVSRESVSLSSWVDEYPGLINGYDKDEVAKVHPVLGQLLDRNLRITVEVLD